MILVIYFDRFHRDLDRMLNKYNIPHRTLQVSNVHPNDYKNMDTIIITGSMRRILRDGDVPQIDQLMTENKKIIGICYGFQYLALKSGGKLGEFTKFKGFRHHDGISMQYNHHDRVLSLPKQWRILNRMENFINIAATDKWIGFQFHPEKSDTNFKTFLLPLLQ